MHVNAESFRDKEQLHSMHDTTVNNIESLKQAKMCKNIRLKYFILIDTGQL